MSSHHIVRDEQEPALYVHEADNFLLEQLGDLLEWSPTVIASARALKKVIDFGIKVDQVFKGPTDELSDALLASQRPIRFLKIAEEDFIGLLSHLEAAHYSGVNIATSAREAGHLMTTLEAYDGPIDCTVHTLSKRWIRIRQPIFEKWLNTGDYGFKAPNEKSITLHDGSRSPEHLRTRDYTFSKKEAGLLRVECREPPFWFVELTAPSAQ
ncbi:MAG: hypothetical protein AAGA85_12390 [Bacteroidota bacterium]